MRIYKISYWDAEGSGTTLIESGKEVDVEEAASAVQEQLIENGIETTPVVVEEFREVTNNPLAIFIANVQRLGL
ncbi:hypothetical protein WDZ92_11140 [Nostoc sp. NIES-2111]